MSETLKRQAAAEALRYVEENMMIGIGTGSTVKHFIELLSQAPFDVAACVPSSEASANQLKACGLPVADLNTTGPLPLYVDGADEFNAHRFLIKGGGAALTREKIIAASSQKFVCIVDQSKQVDVLGQFPLPVEVIPMARGLVARALTKLGGNPVYREGCVTDNGNIILDVHGLDCTDPGVLEEKINNITGVVCNGFFVKRPADVIIMATANGIKTL